MDVLKLQIELREEFSTSDTKGGLKNIKSTKEFGRRRERTRNSLRREFNRRVRTINFKKLPVSMTKRHCGAMEFS